MILAVEDKEPGVLIDVPDEEHGHHTNDEAEDPLDESFSVISEKEIQN